MSRVNQPSAFKSERPYRLGRSGISLYQGSTRNDADQLPFSVNHGNPDEMLALQ